MRKNPLQSFSVLATGLIGCVGTVLLFNTVSALESAKIKTDLSQRAAIQIAEVSLAFAKVDDVLQTTGLLFDTSDQVSRDEFARLAHSLIGRTTTIQSIGFQRIIPGAQRFAYEAEMQRAFPGFEIQEWIDGNRTRAPERDSYRVIDYIEPAADNQGGFGLDTSRALVLNDAVERARDTGLATATNLIPLPQGRSKEPGMVIFLPAYRRGASHDTVDSRRAALIGFNTVAFRAGSLIKQTLTNATMLGKDPLSVSVYMGEYRSDADLIFRTGRAPHEEKPGAATFQLYTPSADVARNFEFAGKPWEVVVAAPSISLIGNHLGSLLTLIGGLLASVLFAVNLQLFAARARRVERMVELRTTELQQSNLSLTKELSARQIVEQALQLRERAIESSANAITISSATAPDYPIIYVNPAFERITGYAPHEVVGASCRVLQGIDVQQAGLNEIRAALREQRAGRAIVRNYRKDGTLFWNDLYVSPVRDAAGAVTHYVASQLDISEMKRYEAELENQASRDTLTGLANRSLLNDRLKKAISQAARYSQAIWVLVFDLDRFKLINDTLGLAAGDAVLKTIARRLKSSAREIDTVARLGADEFALVLPQHTDNGMNADIVQRVMKAVAEYITLDQCEVHVLCSVGIAIYPADGTDAESLLTRAGIAMYRAKEAGRNNFQFYRPEMTERANDRLRIESELHTALERNEFLLHYQPQVDLRSGKIVGMEALIRWSHPTLGMVSPLNFIGIAEENGMIVAIGAWVIKTAVMQNQRWADAGLGRLRVAVNLSARQFAQHNLVEMIAAILKESGMAAQDLEIELTESLIMADVQKAILTLEQLKDLGVLLSVDDFGTGYSSLSYLKRFPIDTLKIDQAFVQDISIDPDNAAIVNAIISLAHNLRLTVIAEGVETIEQLNHLRGQGCDEMQGYHFSRPLAAAAFETLLRSGAGLAAASNDMPVKHL